MIEDLLALAQNYGPPGMLLAYMIWDKLGQRKVDRERIDADLKMATAMTLLTERVGHVR